MAVDACVLINLLATRRAPVLLDALGWSMVATPQAIAQVKSVAGPPDDEGRPTKEAVDVSALVETGHLEAVAVPAGSLDLFVRCSEAIHEADASSIALAAGLQVALATDDGLERRIAAREAPDVRLFRTLGIVKQAVERLGLDQDGMVQLAFDLRTRGNFLPPGGDPDAAWYSSLLRHPRTAGR